MKEPLTDCDPTDEQPGPDEQYRQQIERLWWQIEMEARRGVRLGAYPGINANRQPTQPGEAC